MNEDKDFYTLNELAKSKELPWCDKTTVRKYVEAYSDIFNPKIRGTEGNDRTKRYVIYKRDVERFLDMFWKGELRDFKMVRAGLSRTFDDFISIVSADETDSAKKIRDVAESKELRTDYIQIKNRESFMEVLGCTVLTHGSLILVINGNKKEIKFPKEKPVTSTDIRRIQNPRGMLNKNILLWSDFPIDPLFKRAFKFSGAYSYHEVIGKNKKGLHEVAEWIEESKQRGETFSAPKALYKKRSHFLGPGLKKKR